MTTDYDVLLSACHC